MNVAMTALPDGDLRRPDSEHVSPELALVDPELASALRAGLARARRPSSPVVPGARIRVPSPSAPSRPAWRAVAVASAIVVAVFVLADLRVGGNDEAASGGETTQVATVPPSTGRKPGRTAPKQAPPRSAKPTRVAPTSRRFAWAPVAGASGYEVAFFRGQSRVFSGRSSRAALTLPARWRIAGRRESLKPGRYRWYVWPIVAGKRSSTAVVRAALEVQGG
jgi:hypothetical protein